MANALSSLDFMGWLLIISCTILLTLIGNMIFTSKHIIVHKRLEGLNIFVNGTDKQKVNNKTLIDRIKIMAEGHVRRFIEKNVKKGKLAPLELKLKQAEMNIDPIQHWTQKILYAILLSLLALFLKNTFVLLIGMILGFCLPDLNLNDKIKKRQLRIKSELPDFLDLLAATAPSSKNLEDAIKRVCQRSKGEVTREFTLALEQINAGRKTRDALKDLALRCGVAEMDTLISQINQAESFGTGVEKTLTVQAKKMRKLKKQIAEIRANKAAVTLILPTMLLLVTVLIIIVGPSVMSLLEAQGMF